MWGGDDARESAEIYEVHENMGLPPKEAFIFYSCSGMIEGEVKNWGNVALSLGNGEAIHAWDQVRIDNYLEIENLTPARGWTRPKFTGWAPVERILARVQKKQWDYLSLNGRLLLLYFFRLVAGLSGTGFGFRAGYG